MIETDSGFKLLLDCGMYQGKRAVSNQLNRKLPFDAKNIDAVILSHAHLDHCGILPVLVKNGFSGKIYCTPATAQISKYILMDSASIQEQDAEYFNSNAQSYGAQIFPLYTKEEARKVFELFEPVEYFRFSKEWTKINKNIRFKFYDAGHILGSCVTSLEIKENENVRNIVFTGDLGRQVAPMLLSPEIPDEKAQTLICESTYGDRLHNPSEKVFENVAEIVKKAIKNRTKIIVPAFSLGRTQELIYILHKLFDDKKIPDFPVYIDSPLAQNITEVFKNYTRYFDEEFWEDFGFDGEPLFIQKNLHYVRSVEESKSLNEKQGPFMIISASGMAEAGRVLHHLKNNIGDENCLVMIIGYQAEHTLGRRLQEGQKIVRIYGKEYEVKASVATLDEFSAHADQKEILSYVSSLKGIEKIFLVHGENTPALELRKLLSEKHPSVQVEIPSMGDSVEI